jgi:hypothetical protein
METIYFLIFIGLGAFAAIWVTRSSKTKTDLARKRKANAGKLSSDKLATPLDNRLSHRDQIWESRRTQATKGFIDDQSYVPKSLAGNAPAYDGYSRRGRHHVGPVGVAKEHIHIDEKDKVASRSGTFKSGGHAART